MLNYINLKIDKQKLVDTKSDNQISFEDHALKVKFKDYYFSNVIARSSKTMLECNNSKLNIKSTGTEG